ncbi:MAG TPA: hypothetical protein VKR54_02960 [Candidatus Babeliales bacterium]|jgi:hypothetical protein|nr:hypothetical protein [Candidatus Babeliales bacterium]
MVMRLFVILIVSFSAITPLFSKIYYTGKEEVSLINTIETKNCFVSYVMIGAYTYLLKQKKVYNKQLAVVRDALAAYIAKDLNIAHQVDIVESTKKIPGKIKPWWPATLHTIAPGETVRKQRDCRYNALRLRQLWAQAQSFNEKGLTRLIITYMTWHRQLPEIVALDLIIGNSDRHCGNLCYNPVTDTFCAIDMDDTFNKDLCLLACQKLISMIKEDNVVFTQEEINALRCMKKTLQFLVGKYKPDDIIEKLYFFAKKAGFSKHSELYNARIRKKLLSYEKVIIQSHKSAHQLISLLDKIIKHKFVAS